MIALTRAVWLMILFSQWMTILQFLWPCGIFLSLYILRLRFQPLHIDNCQFPTRQLPSNELLPFFQSYICTIENQCSSIRDYEEITNWEKAPWVLKANTFFLLTNFRSLSVTPVLNIIQTFLNEKDLFEAVTGLPKSKEFLPLITKIATHEKFKYIECKCSRFRCQNFH